MKRLIKTFSVLLIVSSILSLGVAALAFRYLAGYKNSIVDTNLLEISNVTAPTQFYYYDFTNRESHIGKEVLIENALSGNGIKYRFVQFSEIPKNLINAFIAIEDKRFYSHSGVDVVRSARAAFNYLTKGHSSFGGSTITQQLVKNLTGNSDQTATRKIKEIFCALNLENDLDKSEIIELYLNIINLSDGCRGIGAASEHFYSKSPSELTLSECATIASITNNPSKYNPRLHPENLIKRRDIVLQKMLDLGYINDSEYSEAVNTPINLQLSSDYTEGVSSWYVDMVIEDIIDDLTSKYSISREYASFLLFRGGFKIYTAMDAPIQNILDEYYGDTKNFPCNKNSEFPQSAMIILDKRSGDILGVAGAIGEKKANRIQNYATQAKRPSGSAIKPLSVYAPAFEKGIITWSSIIEDSPTQFISNRPWPANANGKYVGNVTVKYAVEHSLNTVAVKILDELGTDNSFKFLREDLQIKNLDPDTDSGVASLALGQSSKGITLRELTGGYTIFSDGIMSTPRSYYKVTDPNGRIILDNTPNQKRVISPKNAAIMTKLLETVVESGTARGLISLDQRISVAGKTGTTQGNRDRFFVGYTPDLLAGAWFGYEYPKSLDEFGGNFAAVFWDEVMTRIYNETAYKSSSSCFLTPRTIRLLTYNNLTGLAPSSDDDPSFFENGWFAESKDHISD